MHVVVLVLALASMGSAQIRQIYATDDPRVELRRFAVLLHDARRENDSRLTARALGGLVTASENLDRFQDALRYANEALGYDKSLGDRKAEGSDLVAIGWAEMLLGVDGAASSSYAQALATFQKVGYARGEGEAFFVEGFLAQREGRYRNALWCYGDALALIREPANRARTLQQVARIEVALGQYGDALVSEQRAVTLYQTTKPPAPYLQRDQLLREAGGLMELGIIQTRLQRYSDALRSQQQALRIYERIDDKRGAALARELVSTLRLLIAVTYVRRFPTIIASVVAVIIGAPVMIGVLVFSMIKRRSSV